MLTDSLPRDSLPETAVTGTVLGPNALLLCENVVRAIKSTISSTKMCVAWGSKRRLCTRQMQTKSSKQCNTKAIYIESPANSTLKLVDIPACAEIAKGHNITAIIHNTFATPCVRGKNSVWSPRAFRDYGWIGTTFCWVGGRRGYYCRSRSGVKRRLLGIRH